MSINIVALDAQAVRTSVDLVMKASDADWSRPTPCASWTLRGLVEHMATQHHGFADAAEGKGDAASWKSRPLGAHPSETYRRAADRVLAAFGRDDVLSRPFALPEILPGRPFPAEQAISFHFIDYVVHSWDVARALGVDVDFDDDLLEVALEVARRVPDGDARTTAGAAFGPAQASAGGSGLDRIVAMLGRSPDWPRPRG